jgi:hypothetical protein
VDTPLVQDCLHSRAAHSPENALHDKIFRNRLVSTRPLHLKVGCHFHLLAGWYEIIQTEIFLVLFLAVNSHKGCTSLQECGRNCAFLCGCRCGRGAALQGIAAAIDRSNHWHRSRDSYHFFRFRRCPLSLGDLLLAGLLCLCDFKCIPLGDGQLSTRPNHCACSLRLCSCPDFTCFPKAPPSGQTIGWARCVRDVAE